MTPGVTIVWAPNPLRTRIELDDVGRRFLWMRLKLQAHEDCMCDAFFELNAEHRKTNRDGTPRTLEERAAAAAKILDLDYILGDEERNGKKIDQYIDERAASFAEDLLAEHCGDCTCVPCSCTKCYAEGLLGIDTLAGLGKHEASKIGGAFKPKDGEEVSIEEAVSRLEDYHPVYLGPPSWPYEEWQKHVPRWIEEGKRAYEWLETYRRAHFAASLSSGQAASTNEGSKER
jgi:hypothetical protein